jgi:glycine oxidase
VRLVEGTRVERVRASHGSVVGVRVRSGELDAGTVVVAAGAWSSDVLADAVDWKTRPRKGQMMALAMPGPLIRRVVRWRNFYVVPRNDDELVVGATDEDAGFDRRVTESGAGSLRAAAETMVPAAASFPVLDTWTGFRPWIRNAVPRIGPLGTEGLYCATGHYRNGVLWAPATSDILESYLDGRPLPAFAEEFSTGPASPVEVSDV